MNERRWKSVMVSQRLLTSLFQGPGECIGIRLDYPKLPDDARVVAINHDWSRQVFVAIVESASFAPVPAGAQIPLFDDGGCFGELTLRYIDGDKLTDRRPIREAAALKWREAELEAAKKMLPHHQFEEIVAKTPELQEVIKAGDGQPFAWSEGIICSTCGKPVSEDEYRHAYIRSAQDAAALIVIHRTCYLGAPAAQESSREWFQRVMSQPE